MEVLEKILNFSDIYEYRMHRTHNTIIENKEEIRTMTTHKLPPTCSISQRLPTDLELSIGLTTFIQLV